MSLVTGLLTHVCSIMRPTFNVDGVITGYTQVGINVQVLISQGRTSLATESGGRMVVEVLTAYMEWQDQTKVNVNDVLTNVTNVRNGSVLQDAVNGGALKNASFKVTGPSDPNFLQDHLELPVEHFHGRIEGQP